MFERFTEPPHEVMDLAGQESDRLRHDYVGPEHVLAGLAPARQESSGHRDWPVQAASRRPLGRSRLREDRGICASPLTGKAMVAKRALHLGYLGLPRGGPSPVRLIIEASGASLDALRSKVLAELPTAI